MREKLTMEQLRIDYRIPENIPEVVWFDYDPRGDFPLIKEELFLGKYINPCILLPEGTEIQIQSASLLGGIHKTTEFARRRRGTFYENGGSFPSITDTMILKRPLMLSTGPILQSGFGPSARKLKDRNHLLFIMPISRLKHDKSLRKRVRHLYENGINIGTLMIQSIRFPNGSFDLKPTFQESTDNVHQCFIALKEFGRTPGVQLKKIKNGINFNFVEGPIKKKERVCRI